MFIDNETPDDAARQLVGCGADVVVVVESTPSFMARFDAAGGDLAYPHRVTDPDDTSDYAVSVVGRRPLGPRSEMRDVGPLRLAIADVDVDGVPTLVVALNPMASVDPGGFDTWKVQIEALASVVPDLPGPLLVVGDLNTTRYRPEFTALLRGRLRDAIDALGKGLSASFKLSARGGAVVRRHRGTGWITHSSTNSSSRCRWNSSSRAAAITFRSGSPSQCDRIARSWRVRPSLSRGRQR